MEYLVVGAGFYGLTIAERLASVGKKVLIIDKRDHIAGNAYSYLDKKTNVEIHKYGSHIFHTSNEKVWKYCNKFTKFNNYKHTVWTNYNNKIYPMPINLATMSLFFEKQMSPDEAKKMILNFQSQITPENLEDKAISLIGKDLYEAFIKGYTEKQWQTDPRLLPPETISRLPVRYDFNINYFDDKYQGIPLNGYGIWAEKMIDNSNIKIELNVDFFDVKDNFKNSKIFYTGPIDKYFNYCEGDLSWRTLDFEFEYHKINDYQGTSVINYSNIKNLYTRIHEFKHFVSEKEYNGTIIAKEYSRFADRNDDPYYPINSEKDKDILKKYRYLIDKEKNVIFGGRLGSYQYLDMHMAIASALSTFRKLYE
jgi:UDP-galactopyranose mutase